MKSSLSQEELLQLFKLDEEIIDVETSDNGRVYPVVKAYDDERVHIHFWCIHCRKWHTHGRGGPGAPYQEGRSGHVVAHCTSQNSPYSESGIILNVVAKFSDHIRKLHREGSPLYCPKCRNQYSAALNACNCGAYFINRSRKSSHPAMAERYQKVIMGLDQKSI